MINYSSIGQSIQQTSKLAELSKRDKINLLRDLMQDLGFIEYLFKDEGLSVKFDIMWERCTKD